MTTRGRILLIVLLILNGLFLPLGCVLIFNTVNPMQVAFITKIHVTNAMDVPIRVTPIGTVGPEGRRIPFPLYWSALPSLPARRHGEFEIAPSQTLTLRYDWDDVNLSELVIALPDGSVRQLVVDPQPTKNQYHRPDTDRFTIGASSPLEQVPPDVMAAAALAAQSGWMWLVTLLGPLPLVTFCLLLRAYRRNRRTPPPTVASRAK